MEDELDLGDRLEFSTDHQEQGRMDTGLKIKRKEVKSPHLLIITHVNIRVGQVARVIVIVAGGVIHRYTDSDRERGIQSDRGV